ncbi:hypothetical protein FRC12_023286 [Ceratobasidium sp. 428]|nr:hypothetical protein FRC12_023286 [Ceratobasidium sp. 428]
MPPRHPVSEQEAYYIDGLFQRLANYQGIPFPTWDVLSEDFQSGAHRIIARHRLPPELMRLDSPRVWPPETVELMARWLRNGQLALDNNLDHLYQPVLSYTEDGQDVLRVTAHPNDVLEYDYEETMFHVANNHFRYPDDAYLTNPNVPTLVPEDLKTRFEQELVAKAPNFRALWLLAEEYEQRNPPQRTVLETDPALFTHFDLTANSVGTYLDQMRLPSASFLWLHPQHSLWRIGEWVFWATQTDALIEPVGQRLYGGHGGVFRLIMAAYLIKKTSLPFRGGHCPQEFLEREDRRSFVDDDKQLLIMHRWLSGALKESIEKTPEARNELTMGGHSGTWWPATHITYVCRSPLRVMYIEPASTQKHAYDHIKTAVAAPADPPPETSTPDTDMKPAPEDDVIDVESPSVNVQAPPAVDDTNVAQDTQPTDGSPLTTLRSNSSSRREDPAPEAVHAVAEPEILERSRRSSSEPPPGAGDKRSAMEVDPSSLFSPRRSPVVQGAAALMPLDSDVTGLMQGVIGSSTPHTRGRSLFVKDVSETAGVAAPNLVPDRADEVKQRAVVAEQLVQPRSHEANRSRSLTSFGKTVTPTQSAPLPSLGEGSALPRARNTSSYLQAAARQIATQRSLNLANTALAASVITPMNAASFATVPVHQNRVVPAKVLKRNLSPDSGGKKKKSRSGSGSGR